ncbi:GNAT family N-acetyltransferase [Leptolyngbya sp. FACHB-17]|uniref:GNAT family N-acetyltransferase n=1 Tax=unclassified Leptolyngbya TaxID=2650499 RepID=UPI001681B1EE|nr:GNAT family N-acetyltransferase [Leptolyngbya sp. FACHB-17]MBD2080638.1 GNAT family N-acetyltransferase [Leptolyngbya sp. FACHB-17]
MAEMRGCPQRVCTSEQTKQWIQPLLLQRYKLQREYDQAVLICTEPPEGGEGQWATSQDKPALQAYAQAYLTECGTGSLEHPWDDWIQQRRITVLEQEGQIVAVVRQGATIDCAIVVAPFTFPQFRRQGFARRLLAFFITEQLQDYSAMKLWVDRDNAPALALYRSLGFHEIGSCYTRYSRNH